MKTIKMTLLLALCSLFMQACNMIGAHNDPITPGAGYQEWVFASNKACYVPGEAVTFSLNKYPADNCTVRYYHQGTLLQEEPLSSLGWTWQPPADDYKGYMVAIVGPDGHGYTTIGVDVSSEPTRFPRNGFSLRLWQYVRIGDSSASRETQPLSPQLYPVSGLALEAPSSAGRHLYPTYGCMDRYHLPQLLSGYDRRIYQPCSSAWYEMLVL